MNFINRDGFELGYVIEGQGQSVVILGSVIYYQRVFSQKLRQHCQLIFLDHRGFAQGAVQDIAQITLDTLVDDIEYMRQELGLQKFVIVGHSGHAYLALAYAKKYSQHVSQIVMIAVGPDQSQKSHYLAEQYFESIVCPERKAVLEQNLVELPHDLEKYPEKRFVSFCLRLGAKSWYDMHFDAIPLWKDVYVNMPIIDHVWGKLFAEIDTKKQLDGLNIPILLMLGVFDYLVAPFYSWYPLIVEFPMITALLFDKSSHCPQFEQQTLFDKQFLTWIQK